MKFPFFRRLCVLVALSVASLLYCGGCTDQDELSHLSVDARINTGVEYLRVFNFEEAYKTLKAVQSSLSEADDQWALATYSLALSIWHKTPPSEDALKDASSLFQAVVEADPDSLWSASAQLDLGRMAEISDFLGDPTDVSTAQSYYRSVIEHFPNTEMAVRAAAFLAQSKAQSFEPKQVQEAIELLNAQIEAQPDSQWIGTLEQYKAQLYAFYLDDYKAALEPYVAAVQAGLPRSSEADASLWQLGLFAQEAGEDLLAARMFARLVTKYPRSIYSAIARQRVIQIAHAHPDAKIEVPELSNITFGR